MKRGLFVLIFLFFSSFLLGEELFLRETIQEANPGNYLVTAQDKNFTFLHIYKKENNYLILEEVNIPAARVPKQGIDWKDWFEQGAPGHTAWTQSLLNMHTGRFEASYSFTYKGWLNTKETDHFMATLLNLKFYSIPNEMRRRIGKSPGYGKIDARPIWHPRLIVEGKAIPHAYFKAFKARWPNDRTELARKKIEIYLPEIADSSSFPTFFPYWVEVEGKLASGRLRVIDSGHGARSPRPSMPCEPITLTAQPRLTKEGLTLTIQTPPRYRTFLLLAEEVNSPFGKSCLLPHQITKKPNNEVTLFVPQEELVKWMQVGERYRFLVSPKEGETVFVESDAPLIFSIL